MPIEVEFDGQVHEFPDDATDADIAAALEDLSAPTQAALPAQDRIGQAASKATGISASPGIIGRMGEAVRNASGVPGILVGAVKQGMNVGAQMGDATLAGVNMLLPDSMELPRPYQDDPAVARTFAPQNEYQQLGQRGVQAAELATVASAVPKVPGIIARGLGVSKARAGANMQEALTAAKDVRVPTTNVTPGIVRAKELELAGANPSRVLGKLDRAIKKAQDGALSTQEAQDFVSNASRMSANEFARLSPAMQRQVSEVAAALRQAITEAAETVGKGDQYARGVKEYARASKAAKAGKRVAQASGALYIGDHILRRITGAIETGATAGLGR